MTVHPTIGRNHLAGIRVASAVAGTLLLLLILLAIVRPEMMGMAMLHKLISAAWL
jgi:hypothetical protein